MILVGVALMIWMLLAEHNGETIKLHIDVDVPNKVAINDYVIVPGYENEQCVEVTADKPGEYDLTFSFIEKGDPDNLLKDNLYILIEYDGVVYCDNKLSELYEGGPAISVKLKRLRAQDIRVVYYIPESVGNEIKGHEVNFDLFITARERRE